MTDAERDALESELEAMSPTDLSPALRERIADALSTPVPSRWRMTWPRVVAAMAAAAAACIAIAAWLGSGRDDVGKLPPPPRIAVNPGTSRWVAGAPSPIASVGDYRRALAESLSRLDTLLDAEASRPLCPPDPATARAFARADREF